MATDVIRTDYLLSKININNQIYEIKDAALEAIVKTLGAAAFKDLDNALTDAGQGLATSGVIKSYVDAQVGAINKFDVRIYTELPTASADTMYILGLVQDPDAQAGNYIEYITIRTGTEGDYSYNWEKIGTTKTDLADYLTKNATVAGVAFGDDKVISAAELKIALGLGALAYKDSATGTVDGQTISGVKATGTSTGSIDVVLNQTSTAASLTKADYTPEGDVTGTVVANGSVSIAKNDDGTQISGTVSAPTITVTPSTDSIKKVTSVGTLPSKAADTFTPNGTDTFTQGSQAAWSAAVTNETLSFSFTANTLPTFTQGAKASFTEGAFDAGTLPQLAAEGTSVVTGITSATADAPVFTGDKFGATFTGSSANIAASFTGSKATGVLVTGVNYDKASVNSSNTKFNGAAITLNVGDITVASKEVTVQ